MIFQARMPRVHELLMFRRENFDGLFYANERQRYRVAQRVRYNKRHARRYII